MWQRQARAQALLTGEQHASWKHATTATGVYVCLVHAWCLFCIQLQGLTQVEEMLISAIMPIMSLYRLPLGQYGYSGHVINLPQDVLSFAHTLPRLPAELDVIIVRKEGAAESHRDFRVRRSVVLAALQWLKTNNKYYHSITIDHQAVVQLPEDGDVTGLHAVTVDTADEAEEDQPTQDGGDPYDSHLDRSVVPIVATRRTEEENVRVTARAPVTRTVHHAPSSTVATCWRNSHQ